MAAFGFSLAPINFEIIAAAARDNILHNNSAYGRGDSGPAAGSGTNAGGPGSTHFYLLPPVAGGSSARVYAFLPEAPGTPPPPAIVPEPVPPIQPEVGPTIGPPSVTHATPDPIEPDAVPDIDPPAAPTPSNTDGALPPGVRTGQPIIVRRKAPKPLLILETDYSGRQPFNVTNMAAGDVATKVVKLSNAGNIAFKYEMETSGGGGPLWDDAKHGLQLRITRKSGGNTRLYEGPLKGPTGTLGFLLPGRSVELELRVWLPTEADQDHQGQSVTLDIAWIATER